MTRQDLLRAAVDRLADAGVEDPARDARVLLRWASGLQPAVFSTVLSDAVPTEEAEKFESAIARREARTPVSHITGIRAFWGRDFVVTPDVLDPRPETEVLIAEALHRGPFRRVLDLGTGSGCLLVTLLAEWPEATGLATDISPAALDVAGRNAGTLGVAGRATFQTADWADGIDGPFDLIVSNPPYLAVDEIAGLSREVREHEPHLALTPGGDGLDSYRAISASLPRLLAPQGIAMLEIGPSQSLSVSAILASAGLCVLGIIPDLDQRARVITARL